MTELRATGFQSRLELTTSLGLLLNDKRIRLLEAIERLGSISQAAKKVPLSYKAAWDALDEIDNLAPAPVVEKSLGGSGGGGTSLTGFGRLLVSLYRAVERDRQHTVDQAFAVLQADGAQEPAELARFLQRLRLRSSARNQFFCRVRGVDRGPVNAEVRLALGEAHELAAQVTRESADGLSLQPGTEVTALVKAGSVILLPAHSPLSSAGNHFQGTVSRLVDGPVNTEVVLALQLQGVARHITAVVTTASAQQMDLAQGTRLVAAFQASAVILLVHPA